MSTHSVPPSAVELPALGVGITYSAAIEPLLMEHPELFDVVEVEPQTLWHQRTESPAVYQMPDPVLEHLVRLPGRKLVHSVGTPVGGTVRPDPAQCALLRRIVDRFQSPWVSDHLSFNATQAWHTGFFLPPRQTAEGVETAVRAIRDLQTSMGVPVAVETGVNYLQPRPDEMADGEFAAAVAQTAQCGLLLDLHNAFANSLNGRQSIEAFVAQLPLDCIWEIHLAGGFELEGFWLDAHSGAIPDPLFELARQVIPALPNLKAIIFEVFPSFVPVAGLETVRVQIEKLHELWALRSALPQQRRWENGGGGFPTEAHTGAVSPAAWETALGKLAIGYPPDDALGQSLARDPGVGLVRQLIQEFRASMIVNVLRLTSRLMMLALGPEVFRMILEEFWSRHPPQPFAAAEAEGFADYLEALDVKVPQLARILALERAALATLIDEQPRVIAFDLDPLPMLRALAEGHLPDTPGQPGQFEIQVTPDGPVRIAGVAVPEAP